MLKNLCVWCFSLAGLCQGAKLFQLIILGHIAFPDKAVYIVSDKSRLPECVDANSLGIYFFKVDQKGAR
jgi:hypothetical protein